MTFLNWIFFLLVQSFICKSPIYVQDCSLLWRFTLACFAHFFMLPKDTVYTVFQCRTNGSDFTGWKCKLLGYCSCYEMLLNMYSIPEPFSSYFTDFREKYQNVENYPLL